MKHSTLLLAALAMLLAACSSSHRPVYSGKEESTEGVPGFVNGKKVSPHIKLGQSYTVDGETYVPRNQPDYVEEGMASWYGPGFHGGKTANGEKFDSMELTAAHRTLPLPSIVRVTMLSTGKQVYVRVNDRGPFAHSRIIDLSRAAAEKVGLVRAGVAKVRVEYMKNETERFTQLLAQGRDPKSIDLASEVLNYAAVNKPGNIARGDVRADEAPVAVARNEPAAKPSASKWERFNPVSSAHAAESETAALETVEADEADGPTEGEATAAPVAGVDSSDLPSNLPSGKDAPEDSPFDMVERPDIAPPPKQENVAFDKPPATMDPKTAAVAGTMASPVYFVQLGAFLKIDNAKRVQSKYQNLAAVEVLQKPNAKGQVLYHVRMGPYASQQLGDQMLMKVKAAGGEEARLIHE